MVYQGMNKANVTAAQTQPRPERPVGSPLRGLEKVVVAGGGEVAAEHGPDATQRCAFAVHAAALALAICPAAAPVTADGAVELDAAPGHGGGHRRVRTGEQEQATTEPVPAILPAAAGTAEGQVEAHGRVSERQGRVLREGRAQPSVDADRDAAPQPVPAVVPAAAGATHGRVAADRGAGDRGGRDELDVDAPASGDACRYGAAARAAAPGEGQVADDPAVRHRHGGEDGV